MTANNSNTTNRAVPWLWTLGILVLLMAITALAVKIPKPEQPQPETDDPIVNVTTMELQPVAELVETMTHKATAGEWSSVMLSAETEGRIVAIEVDKGDMILPGQTLVRLDDTLYRADVERAQVEAEFTEREAKRVTRAAGAASRSETDNAISRAASSKASLTLAAVRLERTEIKAPLELHDPSGLSEYIGRLDSLPVEIGEYLSPGSIVAFIVDTSAIKIYVDAPERDIRYISLGMKAEVVIEALDERKITGTVHYIHTSPDAATRTYRVEIKIPNTEGDIKPGMFARVTMPRRTIKNAMMIPLDAAIPLEKGYEVYIADNGIARRKFVSLGDLIVAGPNGITEIISYPMKDGQPGTELTPGDMLITSGQRLVADGQKIAVRPAVEE